jgi:hypothetical protein
MTLVAGAPSNLATILGEIPIWQADVPPAGSLDSRTD